MLSRKQVEALRGYTPGLWGVAKSGRSINCGDDAHGAKCRFEAGLPSDVLRANCELVAAAPELRETCAALLEQLARVRDKLDMLQREQRRMRDPERTLVCDIIANGALLPDPDGKRYGMRQSESGA